MKPSITFNKIIEPTIIPYTLAEYNKDILAKATRRFAISKAADDTMHNNHLADMFAISYKPPTRWQKLKYRIEHIKQSIEDIWTIISGGDVHKDCD